MNHTIVGPKPLLEALERYWIDRKAHIEQTRDKLAESMVGESKGWFGLCGRLTKEEALEMVHMPSLWWQGGYWDKKAKELKALAEIAAYGEGVVIDDETAEWLKDYWSK